MLKVRRWTLGGHFTGIINWSNRLQWSMYLLEQLVPFRSFCSQKNHEVIDLSGENIEEISLASKIFNNVNDNDYNMDNDNNNVIKNKLKWSNWKRKISLGSNINDNVPSGRQKEPSALIWTNQCYFASSMIHRGKKGDKRFRYMFLQKGGKVNCWEIFSNSKYFKVYVRIRCISNLLKCPLKAILLYWTLLGTNLIRRS